MSTSSGYGGFSPLTGDSRRYSTLSQSGAANGQSGSVGGSFEGQGRRVSFGNNVSYDSGEVGSVNNSSKPQHEQQSSLSSTSLSPQPLNLKLPFSQIWSHLSTHHKWIKLPSSDPLSASLLANSKSPKNNITTHLYVGRASELFEHP